MSLSVTEEDFAQWRKNPTTQLFFKHLLDQKTYYLKDLAGKNFTTHPQPLLAMGELRGINSLLDYLLEIEHRDLEEADDN